MTTINIRIDEKTKAAASKTLADLGLDVSTGIKLFLHQVVTEKGLPFTPTKNVAVLRAKWDAEVDRARHSNTSYRSGKEVLADL